MNLCFIAKIGEIKHKIKKFSLKLVYKAKVHMNFSKKPYQRLALTISALLIAPAMAMVENDTYHAVPASKTNSLSARVNSLLIEYAIESTNTNGLYNSTQYLAMNARSYQSIQDDLEDGIEDDVEDGIEDDVEDGIEDDVEDGIEDDVEDGIEDDVEDDIEDDVEDDIEDDVEDDIEDDVEDDIEDDVEDDIEDDVEGDVEDDVEGDVENNVEGDVENNVEGDAEGEAEHDLEDNVEGSIEENAEHDAEDDTESNLESVNELGLPSTDDYYYNVIEEQATMQIERVIALSTEARNERIFSDNWLVLNDPSDTDFLTSNGYTIISTRFLPSLNKDLIRVEAPKTFKLDTAGIKLIQKLNTSERAVDLNHIYSLSRPLSARPLSARPLSARPLSARGNTLMPHDLISIIEPAKRQRIGIIDTQVRGSHPAFASANIVTADFSEKRPISLNSHGNSVVSILIGQSDNYRGLLSNIDVFAASVFFNDKKSGDITTTESLLKSLDWLVSQDIKVINMSLAGPPNAVLSAAIEKYCQKGVIIVAAVGNNGPNSQPLFPAAYDCVIGVTAITENNLVYRRAVRGPQVDIASYGVNIFAADNSSGYTHVTGTSFAAPFVTAQIVSLLANQSVTELSQKALMDELIKLTIDLGEPGKDAIYGFGALTHRTPRFAQE